MTSFPRGGAENTAPPRCFCRQKRNGFEAGKRESGKAGTKAERKKGKKKGKKKRGKKGKTKAVRIGKGTTAENGKARGQLRGETEEKKEAPGGATGAAISAANPLAHPSDIISQGTLPGVPSAARKIKNTPAARGCKELFTTCQYRCGISARETRCFPRSGNLTFEGSGGGSISLGA